MATPQFPRPDQFATDERVRLVDETGCYMFVDPVDGMEYEYDLSKGAWFPMWNELLVERQQSAYGATQQASESTAVADDRGGSKRKGRDAVHKRENTSVYILGLPLDTTEEEAKFEGKEKQGKGPDKTKRSRVDAKLVQKRLGRLERQLDWFEGSGEVPERYKRTVILTHMFTLEEMEEDVTLMLDLAEDIRSECEKLGTVTSVKVYDLSENGVVAVKFKDELLAQACVQAMNGRFFAGRQVEASIYDGHTRYKSSSKTCQASGSGHPGNASHQDDDADENSEHSDDEEQRMEKYSQWLEAQH
ncbi:hypothetical protein IWW38_003694 [Coemansia aciculifera]|uniref:Uncharacterized protein n=1 Tax=Coemansia aciculifera TaxID=417176 RepID=A0ACC1LZN7_9FUNG|nr:hypothetical protein IWW38_003694 [Coemansia aciculifera]